MKKNMNRYLDQNSTLQTAAKDFMKERGILSGHCWDRTTWCEFAYWLFEDDTRKARYTITYLLKDCALSQTFRVEATDKGDAYLQFLDTYSGIASEVEKVLSIEVES